MFQAFRPTVQAVSVEAMSSYATAIIKNGDPRILSATGVEWLSQDGTVTVRQPLSHRANTEPAMIEVSRLGRDKAVAYVQRIVMTRFYIRTTIRVLQG